MYSLGFKVGGTHVYKDLNLEGGVGIDLNLSDERRVIYYTGGYQGCAGVEKICWARSQHRVWGLGSTLGFCCPTSARLIDVVAGRQPIELARGLHKLRLELPKP